VLLRYKQGWNHCQSLYGFVSLDMDFHQVCILCEFGYGVEENGSLVQLRQAGSDGINRCSKERKTNFQTVPGQYSIRNVREFTVDHKILRKPKGKPRPVPVVTRCAILTVHSVLLQIVFIVERQLISIFLERNVKMHSGSLLLKLKILLCRYVMRGRTHGRM